MKHQRSMLAYLCILFVLLIGTPLVDRKLDRLKEINVIVSKKNQTVKPQNKQHEKSNPLLSAVRHNIGS